jgi:hypothetical protein
MSGWRKRTIMEMAQKTMYRMNIVDDSAEYWTATDNELEAFAKLVREDERARLEHNNEVLMNALWKACGDDEEVVNATIESQGELK